MQQVSGRRRVSVSGVVARDPNGLEGRMARLGLLTVPVTLASCSGSEGLPTNECGESVTQVSGTFSFQVACAAGRASGAAGTMDASVVVDGVGLQPYSADDGEDALTGSVQATSGLQASLSGNCQVCGHESWCPSYQPATVHVQGATAEGTGFNCAFIVAPLRSDESTNLDLRVDCSLGDDSPACVGTLTRASE